LLPYTSVQIVGAEVGDAVAEVVGDSLGEEDGDRMGLSVG